MAAAAAVGALVGNHCLFHPSGASPGFPVHMYFEIYGLKIVARLGDCDDLNPVWPRVRVSFVHILQHIILLMCECLMFLSSNHIKMRPGKLNGSTI
jgi:hypothetical protein